MQGAKVKMELQSATKTADGRGGFIKSWSKVRTLTGTLAARRFSERVSSQSEKVFSTHFFAGRWHPDLSIDEKYRLVHNSENYDITFVNNVGNRNTHMILELLKVKS